MTNAQAITLFTYYLDANGNWVKRRVTLAEIAQKATRKGELPVTLAHPWARVNARGQRSEHASCVNARVIQQCQHYEKI